MRGSTPPFSLALRAGVPTPIAMRSGFRRCQRASRRAAWSASGAAAVFVAAVVAVVIGASEPCLAQPAAVEVSAQTALGAASASPSPAQRFAPGVLTTIPATIDRQDAILVRDLVEIRRRDDLAWDPVSNPVSRTLYEMAHNAPFVQDIWCLEFTFKPLRMISVDIPQASGRMQRKLVWYMVYRVRNTGVGTAATIAPDGTFNTESQGLEPLRFVPQFVLSSKERDRQGELIRKEYLDRVIPSAMGPIQDREFGGEPLLHSVEMAAQELSIESGRSERGLWGVAMWEGVDPELDFFSVEVGGLTNAYRWEDSEEGVAADAAPGTGRKFERRVLQLNFWRPGDEYGEDEREIRLGAAAGKGEYYEGSEGVASRWVFR
jgi:hypothetical protein